MAENLNYKSENSWCFNNDTTNCTEYGRLYDWKTAQEVCPNDWRLPIKAEYKELLDCIGGNTEKKCKALLPGGSTGFSYKSLGHRIIEEDKFKYVKGVGHPTISKFISTANGFYWTSSAKDNENAYFLLINGLDNISIVYSDKRWGLAVRCIYDKADN